MGCGGNQKGENYDISTVNKTVVTEIAGHSLKELRDFHKRDLFDEYIKLWDWRGIDREYGGFFMIEILDRMIKNKGRVSNFLETA